MADLKKKSKEPGNCGPNLLKNSNNVPVKFVKLTVDCCTLDFCKLYTCINIAPYNSKQYNTIQYNTIQYSRFSKVALLLCE